MSRRSFWLALGLGALMIGGGAYLYLSDREAPLAQAATPAGDKIVTVEAERVVVDTVLEDIRAVGTLAPNEAVIVSSEIAGRIDRIHFAEGDEVKAGDVLVELDSTMLRAELAKAQSDLTLAESNHERATTLARQRTGTLRARDEAIAAFQVAKAELELARARLEKASIRAPLSGVIGLRAVSVGAYVTPGARIVELAGIDPIKVDFRVPELVLSSLRVGQHIRVTIDALPGRTFEGTIYVIDPIVDANGRAVRLRALAGCDRPRPAQQRGAGSRIGGLRGRPEAAGLSRRRRTRRPDRGEAGPAPARPGRDRERPGPRRHRGDRRASADPQRHPRRDREAEHG